MAVFGDDGKYDPDTGDVLVLARCSYPLMVVLKQSCDTPFRVYHWPDGQLENLGFFQARDYPINGTQKVKRMIGTRRSCDETEKCRSDDECEQCVTHK
uniref:Uncharacterized protein n=1 Tax=Romanomermis culicivorax TaxID=13658 RepID=A0A915JKD6_ROMCU